MAIAAFKTSAYRNAVSRLHRQVSQQMWQDLWPKLPVWEVPITSITNGVHLPSWINGDLAGLYDQYLQPDWRESHAEPKIKEHIAEIPGGRAVGGASPAQAPPDRVRAGAGRGQRFGSQGPVFRGSAAAGGAQPGRPDDRIRAPLRHLQARYAILPRPGAAQAHPDESDAAGADRDRRKGASARCAGEDADPRNRSSSRGTRNWPGISCLSEDYGIQVARELVGGVDLWLNTPRRGEEACGTSGMKAGHQRRPESEHPGRLVRRGGRALPGAGQSATANPIRRTATTPTPPACIPFWRTRSCPCSMRTGSRAYRWNGCSASNNRWHT